MQILKHEETVAVYGHTGWRPWAGCAQHGRDISLGRDFQQCAARARRNVDRAIGPDIEAAKSWADSLAHAGNARAIGDHDIVRDRSYDALRRDASDRCIFGVINCAVSTDGDS